MSTATDSVDRWTEVTISVGTDRFDGAIHPLNTTVYVRLKSLTDHLHMDYEGQYYKVTHDPRYSEAIHIRDRQVKANGDFLRKRSWSGREYREYLYLPLSLVEQYLSDLRPSRIRDAEGRSNAQTLRATLVAAIQRGFTKQRPAGPGVNGTQRTTPDLETLIRQHFDQTQAIVQRIAEERREQAEQQRRKREAQALREREPQERARREAERRRHEEERRRNEEKRRAARSRSTASQPWWIVLAFPLPLLSVRPNAATENSP